MTNTLRHYLTLCRVSNLPTVWTNVLAAVLLSRSDGQGLYSFVPLALALSAFYAGGMCLNDLWDRSADAVAKAFRPIPSGKVGVGEAGALTAGLFAFGLLILWMLPFRSAVWAGMALVLTITAYDALHAKHRWSVFLMAACRLLVYVVSALGAAGRLDPGPLAAGLAQFCYVVALSAVARYEKGHPFPVPLIPAMIGGISLLDGAILAVWVSPGWFWAGAAGAALTWVWNRWVRGD